MFGEIPKLFGRGFVIGYLFPAAILLTWLTYGLGADPLAIGSLATISAEALGRAALAIVVVALLLLVLNRPFVRILESYYWLNPLRLLRALSKKRFARDARPINDELERLEAIWRDNNDAAPPTGFDAKAAIAAQRYPHRADLVLPTRFGNSYRAYESYSTVLYGIDAVVLWPRLMCLIPPSARDQLQESRAKLDFHVNLFWLALIAAIAGGYAALPWPGLWLALLRVGPPLGLMLLLWFTLPAIARAWGVAVASIFDLYRSPLAEALGLERPSTLDEERTMWIEACRAMLYRRAFTADFLDRYRTGGQTKQLRYQQLAELLYVKHEADLPCDEPAGE